MDIIFNILLVAVLFWFIYQRFVPTKGIKQSNTTKLKQLLEEKNTYQFIDVRTPMEFRNNHIKGFSNIPLNELTTRHTELNQDKEIVVICQSGMRSNKATKILKKQGFTKITNIRGGMAAWSH
ncbi:rhodanese-like domain-containing protein [Evansella sp. AB-rgal1]|uniref:rhodanese-like domain-containing protein n=1 Tax=Evansella sp. AB-rgal1 TaxID=3242696 RepID=UPI00359EE763